MSPPSIFWPAISSLSLAAIGTACASSGPINNEGDGTPRETGAGGRGEASPEEECEIVCGRCGGTREGEATQPLFEDCEVEPINPKASQATKNLLCYLYSISGKQVLSGQQETSWDNPHLDMEYYDDLVGDYPAVLGADLLYPVGTSLRSISYAREGGIILMRYHMGAPPEEDTYENSKGRVDMGAVLTPGTVEHESLLEKLDYAAAELDRLACRNVPVIWAPYHEFQPNGWFWWSKGSPEQFRELWEFTYEYLTNEKKLNNLIWLAPTSQNPSASWLPWPEHHDLAGPDNYFRADMQPFTELYDEMAALVPEGRPIPLHETGTIPQPEDMFPATAPWLLWSVWAGYQLEAHRNTPETILAAYQDERTITRSEVPRYR